MNAPAEAPPRPEGWRRLVHAALKLAAKSRSIRALGLRELARAAELNPNTFYRHFRDMDHLALEIINDVGRDLRANLRQIRQEPGAPEDIARRTVEHVFDFAKDNPDAITVAVVEIHGASPLVRKALRELIQAIGADFADDVRELKLAPGLDDDDLAEFTVMIVRQMLYLALEYLEQPRRREQVVQRAARFIVALLTGAQVLNRPPK
jgi:AcrR family transcriptional regulator